MIKQYEKISSFLLIAAISVVLVSFSTNNIYAFHESKEPKESDGTFSDANAVPVNKTTMAYKTVHDLVLSVTYVSSQGTIESDDFTYYSQISGFNRNIITVSTGSGESATQTKPAFILEGIVTPEHHLLYDMVDTVWALKNEAYRSMYSQNDFYIALLQDNIPIRTFKYENCKVTDYKIDTLYDGLFTYDPNGGGNRAFVDKFLFECDGYQPLNDFQVLNAKSDIKEHLEAQKRTDKKINWHDESRSKKSKIGNEMTWQDYEKYGMKKEKEHNHEE